MRKETVQDGDNIALVDFLLSFVSIEGVEKIVDARQNNGCIFGGKNGFKIDLSTNKKTVKIRMQRGANVL